MHCLFFFLALLRFSHSWTGKKAPFHARNELNRMKVQGTKNVKCSEVDNSLLQTMRKVVGSVLLSVGLGIGGSPMPSIAAENTVLQQRLGEIQQTLSEGSTLQSQIQQLRLQEVDSQKEKLEKEEQKLIAQELLYPDGFLVARGTVILSSPDNEKIYPYGLTTAGDLNPIYTKNDRASIFLLAVGRDGPPLAAKRYLLKDTTFPFAFELTADDLLFPYTMDAWMNSAASKDSLAVTAILSSFPFISEAAGDERYGFALSELTTFAGKTSRSTAAMKLLGRVDTARPYNEEEKAILQAVDDGIQQHEQRLQQQQAKDSTISKDNFKSSTVSNNNKKIVK